MASEEKRQFQDFVNATLDLSENLAKLTREHTGASNMWTSTKKRRRIVKAITSCCPVVSEKIQSVGQMNVENCFVQAAGMYYDTPERLEEETYLATAAALWIRDQIEEIPENISFLLEIAREPDLQTVDADMPPVNDPARPAGVDEALVKIVANRLTKDHYLYEDYSPSRYGPTDALYRKVLDEIDPGFIEEAENVFLDRLMAYLETAMKIAKMYLLKMDREFAKFMEKIPQPKTALAANASVDVAGLLEEDQEFRGRVDPVTEMYFMINQLQYLVLGRKNLLDGNQNQDKVMKITGEFDPLHTSDGRNVDPFTMAFGYCRFMDKNDDFVFLLGVSVPLMRIYSYLFPWSGNYYEKKSDVILPAWCDKSKNIFARRVWYKDEDDTMGKSAGAYCSLAQFVYDRNRLVLTGASAASIEFWVEKKTLTSSDIMLMADTITMLDEEIRITREMYDETEILSEKDEPEDEEPEETEEEEEKETDAPVSERELQLQNQLKEAHDLLKASERSKNAAEKELRKLREDTNSQRRELFDLRELIYKSMSEDEPEEDVAGEDREMLPCTIQKRTVIFGGHETWRKAIKDMLAGVTIAPNKKQVNTDLIRHADVIWIQVNAIPHAAYYAICDYARSRNVPIRYFTFNSAAACAIQLAKADAEINK